MSTSLTRLRLPLLLVLLCNWYSTSAQLVVTSAVTDSVVIQNFLGPGVIAWNRQYTGAAPARGLFNCAGACNIGLSNGIMITSGSVTNAVGNNNGTGAGTANGTGSDPNLNTLAPGSTSPQDAAVIRFNFRVAADSVNFDYVWASEEYHDYVGSNCNDVFGFFISGPLITGTKNIALIPGTTTPIAINTVNNGFAGPWPAAGTGPCTNCQYFVNNTPSTVIQYDAFTTVLTARERVCPCEDYTFKMGVQDFCDGAFDSGVFLKGNSFKPSGEIPLVDSLGNELATDTLYICPGETVQLCVNGCRAPLWTTGDTTFCIEVDTTGLYAAAITNYSPPSACFAFTKSFFVLLSSPVAQLSTNGPTSLCPDDSVLISAPAGGTGYLWNTGATSSSILVGAAGDYFCTVTYGNGCIASSDTVSVTVNSGQTVSIAASGPLSFCQGGSVTLTASSPTVIWSNGSAAQSITVNTSGTYVVTPNAAGFCPGTKDSIIVTVFPTPTVSITGNTNICQGASTTLNASPGFSQYQWSGGQNTASVSVSSAGTYVVTATNANGCTDRDSIQVSLLPVASTSISGNFSFCQGASTSISAGAGFSTYQWSTGANTQSINVTAGGTYTVTVTAAGQCPGSASQQVIMNMNPLAAITGTTAICQGANANLIASPAGLSYQWSNGSTASSIQPSVAGTYTLIVIDGNGCRDTVTQLVNVNNNPAPVITGTPQACPGDSSLLSVAPGFASYVWSNGSSNAGIYANTAGTYTVTVTDANNCSGTTNVNFSILPFTPVTINGPAGFCTGRTANLTASAGYTNYNWSNGASSALVTVGSGGTYTVTVTAANGCTGSESYTITEWALPSPTISGNSSYCQGSNLSLQAGPAGLIYEWSNGSAASSITVSAPGTYTLTVTDPNGCSNSTSRLITENPNPQPVITGQFSVCSGSVANFDATYTGAVSYQWSTGANTAGIQPSVAGTYTVTVTDANGCSGSTSQNLTVNPLPIISITGTNIFCDGDSVLLSAVQGPFANYQWSSGSTASTQWVNNGGSYLLTVTDANNCSSTASYTVTENPLPQPSLPAVTNICDGFSTILQAGSFASYLWSDGTTGSSITVSANGSYTLTVTDNNGCSNSTTAQVIVNPNPVPLITGTFQVCTGDNGLMEITLPNISSYQWSNGGTGPSISPSTAGTYTVTVTDNNGCTGTTSQLLVVNSLPSINITGINSFCDGDSVILSSSPANFSNYVWSNGASTSSILVTNGGTYTLTVTDINDCINSTSFVVTENPLPQPLLPANTSLCDGQSTVLQPGTFGTYTWSDGSTSSSLQVNTSGIYTVTVSDNNGCSNSVTAQVVVHPNPTPVITGPDDICAGQSAILDPGSGYVQYLWSTGAVTALLPVSTSGSYTVSVTDINGCTGSAIFDIAVFPLPLVQITGDLSICEGESTRLETISGQGSYAWSNGGTDPFITVTDGGNYTVTVTTSEGCTKSEGVFVKENPLPRVSYVPQKAITCDELRVIFQNTSTYESGASFYWNFGDGSTSREANPVHIYAAPADYITSLRIISPAGCTDADTVVITLIVPPLPEAEFSQSARVVSVFNSEVSFSNRSVNAERYKWSFGDGQSSEEENPVHIFDKVGTLKIKLIAFNEANCIDEFETNLEVVPFFVPNAFTPNNDGKNDVFFDGSAVLNVSSFDMLIFNRWGQNIYTTDSFLKPWDGLGRDGKEAPEGLYTYLIKITSIKGKYYEYAGTFSLIR